MKSSGTSNQGCLGFDIVGIRDATVYRADGRARLVVMKTHALRAQQRVDNINLVALSDRVVSALWFTRPAVDALVSDHRCHWKYLPHCFVITCFIYGCQ